jgi:hypothetical protein
LMGKPNYTHELGNPGQHVKPGNGFHWDW